MYASLLFILLHVALCVGFGSKPPGLHANFFQRNELRHDQLGAFKRATNTLTNTSSSSNTGWGTFDQLLDHSDVSLGTFSQRFWFGTQYWRGPGSPIILVTPGESSGTGFNTSYLTTSRITGLFAEAVGGAIVILEHRYWGESAPVAELDVAALQHLTLDNALRDFAYFARHWTPPFDRSGRSQPATAPWIFAGGSYAGALAAWSANPAGTSTGSSNSNSTESRPFWAYYATSGVVQAIGNFWQYFDAVRQASPANCSADLQDTMAYIDNVLHSGNETAKAALKAPFLLGDLEDADFANTLAYGPLYWQSVQPYDVALAGYDPYHRFCDYVENVWPGSNATVPGAEGVGVTKALTGYAKWVVEMVLPGLCASLGYADFQGTYNTGCLANLNASSPAYTDLSADNPFDRQWAWMTCNEPLAWFQTAASCGRPSIVSRLVNYDYYLAQCALMFPGSAGSFGLASGRTVDAVNAATGGWSVDTSLTPRLLYTNGEFDPWRPATVSSDDRPGGPLASSASVPVRVLPGGFHVSDVYASNWAVNADIKAAADEQAATLVEWVAEFYEEKGLVQP